MIPIKLTIKGLFSYQKEQIIDFEPLVDSQIFGVFGGVGSGKSSILDAITFALYGELDRLGQRDSRAYNMLNLKSNELLIDFEFKTGPREVKYKYVVTAKRNSKNFEEVKSFIRKAYQWNSEKWMPIDSNNTENIIGISYQNFRRTVIIPQGKFQEFLQLGSAARSQMLKEIFNLGKYDLSFKTGHLQKINNSKLDVLEGEIKHYENLNQQIIHDKKQSLNILSSQNKEEQSKHNKLETDLSNLKEVKNLFEKIQKLTAELDTLELQKETFVALEQQITLLTECLIDFKPLLDGTETIAIKTKESQLNLSEINQFINSNTKILLDKQTKIKSVKPIVDQKVKLYTEIEELKKVIEIQDISKRILETSQRLEKGSIMISTLGKSNSETNITIDSLSKLLVTQKRERPDYQELATIDTWYKNDLLYKKQSIEAKNDLNKEQSHLKNIVNQFHNAPLTNDTTSSINYNSTPDKTNGQFEQLLSTLSSSKLILEEELIKLKTHLNLGQWAEELHDNDACPLCGSLEHPSLMKRGSTQQYIEEKGKELKTLNSNQKKLELAKNNYNQYQFLYLEKEKVVANLDTKYLELEVQTQNHKKSFKWSNYDSTNRNSFSAAYSNANNLETSIIENEKKLTEFRKLLVDAQSKLDKYKLGIKKIEQDHTTLTSTKDTLTEQISSLIISDYLSKPKADLLNFQNIWTNNITKAEKDYEQLDNEIDDLNTQLGLLKGRFIEEDNQFKSLVKELKSNQQEFDHKLLDSKLNTVDQIKSILAEKESLSNKKNSLDDYKTNLKSTQKSLSLLKSETKDIKFDPIEFENKLLSLTHIKAQIKNRQEQIGSYKQELESLEKDLIEKTRIEKELKQLNLRKENINTLNSLFKGKGFVDYISSVYLTQLCHVANARFYTLTRHQLKLELSEKNDFKVIDFLNDAKQRSVKTLSGGQTFQASLSLALALAESVQHQSKSKQNFFFLDEGFGTQDKASLQVVFDTIKSLRKENRVVGIISHLEELQNEIDVFIEVKNDIEVGSQIATSY